MECRRLVQIFLPALFLWFLCAPIHAITVENLYSVVIQTDDNSIATRNQQLPQAFAHVIQKVGSSAQILNHPEYVKACDHLDRFVSHYFYTQSGDKYNLTLRFNEQMINHLLAKMQRPTLGKNRAQVLVWLVIENNHEKYFITHANDVQASSRLNLLADTYGIPMILPLLDLTERLFINENDVMNADPAPFLQAAQRYSTDTVLMGRIRQSGDAYVGDWRLIEGANDSQWSQEAPDLNAGLEAMVGKLADELIANKHHMQERDSQYAQLGITVRINGISSSTDYARVLDQLKHLSSVQKVEVGSVANNQATFIVTAEGGRQALLSSLKTSHSLVLADNENETPTNSVDLIYRVGR